MPSNQSHKNTLNKRLSRPFIKLKVVTDVFMVMLFSFAFNSCDSENIDSIKVNPVNQASSNPEQSLISITDIILDKNYSEFNEALNYVNDQLYTSLVEDFDTGTAQHTVFIPSNDAFYKLYDCLGMKTQDIAELSNPGLVRDILQYHVVKGKFDLDNITNNDGDQVLESFYGKTFTVKSDGRIEGYGNSARIDLNEANQIAINGIVHVITEVILPIEAPCTEPENN